MSVLGLGALSLFGGLIGAAEAGNVVRQEPPTVQVQPKAQTQALSTPAPTLGDPLKGPLLMEEPAQPAAQPKAAAVDSLVISEPSPQRGDYVSHGVNFSQLLTNHEFTNDQAATAGDLQTYLESRNSFLAGYEVDGQSASEMIIDASKEHHVNPWVLLTTLEKENSLVSRQRQPRAGVLRASMGYGYTDGGRRVGKSGFAHQLDRGAGLLRSLYDEAQGNTFPMKMKVDYGKRTIQVDNAATLALMRYTPHTVDTHLSQVGGGNYRFRTLLEDFSEDWNQLATRQGLVKS